MGRFGRLHARRIQVKTPKLLFVIVVLVLASRPMAEEIQLKDGSKITGKLVGVAGETFQVKTNYGDINVPRSEVVSITFPENASKDSATAAPALPSVDEELKGSHYQNRTGKFQLDVPLGWKIAPELRTSKDVIAALDSPDETLFFMVTPEQFVGTLATYKVLAETQYQKNFSGYVNDGETEVEVDGRKGIRLIWHGTSKANSADLKFLVYLLPYDGRMVRLSFFTLPPLFTDGVPVFEKIAASYHTTPTK
jgi:hypothetical protein